MEFIVVAIIAVISFYVGWKAREIHAVNVIQKLTSEISEKMVEDFKDRVVDVTVEKNGDFFYIYRKDDGTFLGQGTDIDSLSDKLIEKFPGKLFNVSPEELAQLEATK